MRTSREPSIGEKAGLAVLDKPPAQAQFGKPDDDSIALQLVKDPAIAGKLSYFHGGWKMYDTGCWTTRDVYEVRRYVRQQLRNWRQYGISVSQQRIKALSSMLEDDLFIADRKIIDAQDQQRKYINLRNGLFNLDTMTFEPTHSPDLYFTTQLDFDYDEDAQCPNFLQYLNSSLVLPDSSQPDGSLIRLVLEALAYSMTARTDMKSSFWLVGKKDSGKSTFVSLLKSIMGNLHTTIDLTQLGVNRFLLAGIVGKRVVSFTESDSNSVLPDALYKTLVGGSDEIYADVKNRDPICFRPECKVWWAMNDGQMPRISDRSGATMRRIIIIPFNRTVPERERINGLEQLLMKERSGIFNKMVTYLKRLQNGGSFEKCQQSEDRWTEYVMENDTEATFIQDCFERHESYKIRGGDLYERYTGWCLANGFKPKNSNQVAKEWRRLGFVKKESDGNWWIGLKPLPTPATGKESEIPF